MLIFGARSFYAFICAHINIHIICDSDPHTPQISSSLPCSKPSRQLSFLLFLEHEQHTANSNQHFNQYFVKDSSKICVHSFIHSFFRQMFISHLKYVGALSSHWGFNEELNTRTLITRSLHFSGGKWATKIRK